MTDFSENLLGYSEKESVLERVVGIVVNAFILLLIALFAVMSFFEPVLISGSSMENTVFDGETVIVTNAYSKPERGDIVVIDVGETNIIKRVVAIGGDKVGFVKEMVDGKYQISLYLDRGEGFARQDEPFIKESMQYSGAIFKKFTVAESLGDLVTKTLYQTVDEGKIVALGDNRNVSKDSRYYGHFDFDDVVGKTIKIFRKDDDSFAKKLIEFIYTDKKPVNNN